MSEVSNLNYVIDGFSLNIPRLEILDDAVTAVTGRSGSGKTTFFQILIGLIPLKKWSWIMDGVDLAKLSVADRRVGVVFQSYELFPHLTAEQNIYLVMKSRNNLHPDALEKMNYFKNKLNLEKIWRQRAGVLSGGEQQRVALLRAVLSRPRILLLDEPFSALDVKTKEQSYEVVKSVLLETKLPALMITHNLQEAAYFTERILEFSQGRVVSGPHNSF